MNEKTEADSIAQLARDSMAFQKLEIPGHDTLLVFPNGNIQSLERYSERPRRKRAAVCLHDQASFADYVKAHSVLGTTALFGKVSEEGGSFSAVLDYHEQVGKSADPARANWGQHQADFTLAFTPEWKRWMKKNDEPVPQATFADFIEDNLADIIDPDAATLLEIAQDLVAKLSADFKSGLRLNNGQQKLVYDETITATGGRNEGNLEVPSEIKIRVAPFAGTEPVEIKARLRFRIQDKRLFFIYKLNSPHKIVEEAFQAAREFIATSTGIPVLLGCAKVVS